MTVASNKQQHKEKHIKKQRGRKKRHRKGRQNIEKQTAEEKIDQVGLQKLPTYETLYKMIHNVNSPVGLFNLLESSPCIESVEKWYPKYRPFGLHCQMSPCCHLVTNYT
jgi:hypothetical protein